MKKVTPGQKFNPQANAWNSFIDAALYVKQRQNDLKVPMPSGASRPIAVMVRNGSDAVMEQFSAVMLGDLLIKPQDNAGDFRGRAPVFEAENISADNLDSQLAILQEPLAVNRCGRALTIGVTPARLTIADNDHKYATVTASGLCSAVSGPCRILWKESEAGENKWAVLQLGTAGSNDPYNGYFKAVDLSDAEVGIVNGAISDELLRLIDPAGHVVVNDIYTEIDPVTIVLSEGDNFIYLELAIDEGSGTVLSEFKVSATFPEPENLKAKVLIAVALVSDGTITNLAQQQHGVITSYIFKSCTEDSGSGSA